MKIGKFTLDSVSIILCLLTLATALNFILITRYVGADGPGHRLVPPPPAQYEHRYHNDYNHHGPEGDPYHYPR